MRFFFSYLVLLLYDIAIIHGCEYMYKSEQQISFNSSSEKSYSHGVTQCTFFLEAPIDHYVMLNLTHLAGSSTIAPPDGAPLTPSMSKSGHERTSTCLPKLSIAEIMDNGAERESETLCGAPTKNNNPPKVFQLYSQIVKLIYQWDTRDSMKSGFSAQLRFRKWPSGGCRFKCKGGDCLPESSLVCNGIYDCEDGSDEHECSAGRVTPGASPSPGKNLRWHEVLIITIAVVFIIAVITCIVLKSARCSEESHQQLSNSTDGTAISSHSPRSTEVVYVPGSMDGNVARERELQRDRRVRLHPPGRELNLPPHIQRSEDGEEGYAASQRLLQSDPLSCEEYEAIRPPPNKTIFQGESPPPYRVQPNGKASSRHPPRKTDCSCGTPQAYHTCNNNDLNPVGGAIPYTLSAAGTRHTRAVLGNHPHGDGSPRTPAHTTGHSRSGDYPLRCPHNDNSCQSNHNGVSYDGPPPRYSEVVQGVEQGLPSSNPISNSNV